MTFEIAVKATSDIKDCFQNGLLGLGKHSNKVELSDPARCEGSVDIDSCLTKKYPTSNRWDYAFSYKGDVYFIEVHSAQTSEVKTVLSKLNWLKNWLRENASEIDKLKARKPYYWVQSGGFAILPNSRQFRAVSQNGIKPISRLALQ